MPVKLIADSGSTKCEWCLLYSNQKKKIYTQGISPYFLSANEIEALLNKELLPKIKNVLINQIHYYGTGLGNPNNIRIIKSALKNLFPIASIYCNTDMLAAARALCKNQNGIACILGTGSNSCFYNGRQIKKNISGLGYVLGDEGSGAYLGKKIIQHFLYNNFDKKLAVIFNATFKTSATEILEHVYTMPLPNKYLAGFTIFLANNRRHKLVERIIEDALNDFFVIHLYNYKESWLYPINFTGSVAYGFKDVIKALCKKHKMHCGKIIKHPLEQLVAYHNN